MVDMGAARMTPVTPNPAAIDLHEVALAELIEALARMVNRIIQHGKAEAQSALRDTLKKAENATIWIVKPLILRDSESAAPNFSVFP
jgi:hypothetical protein